jgi:hypothetical protein
MIEINFLLKMDSWVIVSVLLVLMFLFVYIGFKFGRRSKLKKNEKESDSLLTAGIYTLMGLLLAFTFSMAGTRFDSRKKIIVDEANDIGTAILRSKMYPDSIRILFMEDFRNYLEARIAYSEARDDIPKIMKSLEISDGYGNRLFSRASELSLDPKFFAASNQMIPALNSMIDVANERLHGELYKVPDVIIMLILLLSVISSFIYGYTSEVSGKRVDWYLAVCYCIILSLVIYFILDLDRPRRGLINLNETNRAIIDVRKSLE